MSSDRQKSLYGFFFLAALMVIGVTLVWWADQRGIAYRKQTAALYPPRFHAGQVVYHVLTNERLLIRQAWPNEEGAWYEVERGARDFWVGTLYKTREYLLSPTPFATDHAAVTTGETR